MVPPIFTLIKYNFRTTLSLKFLSSWSLLCSKCPGIINLTLAFGFPSALCGWSDCSAELRHLNPDLRRQRSRLRVSLYKLDDLSSAPHSCKNQAWQFASVIPELHRQNQEKPGSSLLSLLSWEKIEENQSTLELWREVELETWWRWLVRKSPDPHAGINQEGRRDDVGQPGAYAEADQTSKPAIWLRDLPGSGQQRRPEMRKHSLSR